MQVHDVAVSGDEERVLDEFREREHRPPHVALDDLPPLEAMDAPPEQGETMAALWRAIEGLPADLKMALVLRDVLGLSYPEIAEALEIRLSTVKWRIFAAREEVALVLSRAELDALWGRR